METATPSIGGWRRSWAESKSEQSSYIGRLGNSNKTALKGLGQSFLCHAATPACHYLKAMKVWIKNEERLRNYRLTAVCLKGFRWLIVLPVTQCCVVSRTNGKARLLLICLISNERARQLKKKRSTQYKVELCSSSEWKVTEIDCS